tara:strand:+ start:243 stop:461 length:219 start_codon:yes stop_codon:yes gene_type:complete
MRPSPTTIGSLRSFCTTLSEVARIRNPVPKTGANVYILGKGVVLSKKTIETIISIKPIKLNNSPQKLPILFP